MKLKVERVQPQAIESAMKVGLEFLLEMGRVLFVHSNATHNENWASAVSPGFVEE